MLPLSKRTRKGTWMPSWPRIFVTSCVASSECPPNSTKLSCRPTRSTFSTSPQTLASSLSVSPCGTSYSLAPFLSSTSGNALRTTFPPRHCFLLLLLLLLRLCPSPRYRFFSALCNMPPTACLPAHHPAPSTQLLAPLHAPAAAPRSPPPQPDTLGSSPGNHSVL